MSEPVKVKWGPPSLREMYPIWWWREEAMRLLKKRLLAEAMLAEADEPVIVSANSTQEPSAG